MPDGGGLTDGGKDSTLPDLGGVGNEPSVCDSAPLLTTLPMLSTVAALPLLPPRYPGCRYSPPSRSVLSPPGRRFSSSSCVITLSGPAFSVGFVARPAMACFRTISLMYRVWSSASRVVVLLLAAGVAALSSFGATVPVPRVDGRNRVEMVLRDQLFLWP